MVYLPKHAHCQYCGNPVAETEKFCDEDCKALYDAETEIQKKKDRSFFIKIGVSLVAVGIVGLIIQFI